MTQQRALDKGRLARHVADVPVCMPIGLAHAIPMSQASVPQDQAKRHTSDKEINWLRSMLPDPKARTTMNFAKISERVQHDEYD